MDGVVHIIVAALNAIATWAARRYYGRTPTLDQLDAGTLAKLKKFADENRDAANQRTVIALIGTIWILLALAIIFAVAEELLTFGLIVLGGLLLSILVIPIWTFVRYGRDRRSLILKLRTLGRLNTCPRCEYDLSHTTSDYCPECGEAVYTLPV